MVWLYRKSFVPLGTKQLTEKVNAISFDILRICLEPYKMQVTIFDELAHLVPVQDDHGEPYRSSGAFAVVFKMKDEQTGKFYALKCFTEEQEGRAEAYRQIADELEFRRFLLYYFCKVLRQRNLRR